MLGLTFVDCFPKYDDYTNKIGPPKLRVNSQSNVESVEFDYYPYLGYGEFDDINLKGANQQKYFFATNEILNKVNCQVRPSSRIGLSYILKKNRIEIVKKFRELLEGSQNKKSFSRNLEKMLNKDSDNFLKLFSKIYPVMMTLNTMITIFNSFKKLMINSKCIIFGEIKFIVKELNKINAYYFINYYLFTSGDKVKIPNFYYYKIPMPYSQEKSLIFQANENSILQDKYEEIDNADATNDDKPPSDIGQVSLYNGYDFRNNFNEFYIKSILEGKRYVTTKTIQEHIIKSKKKFLPPSITDYYLEFYKYGVLKIIIDLPENIQETEIKALNKTFLVNTKEEKSNYLFNRANIIDNILSRYFNWFVRNKIWGIMKEKLGGNTIKVENPGFIVEDFSTTLNKSPESYSKKFVKSPNFLKFNENKTIDDSFILYSNDYTNNNLSTSFMKFVLDHNIMIKLLQKGAKPYLINNNSISPINSILSNYYYKIFDTLKNQELTFTKFYQSSWLENRKSNTQQPIKFIFSELKNHLQKLLNMEKDNNKILENFSFNQYKTVELIIKNNERFGNNILKNLKLSYSVLSYILNQYFFKNIFKLTDSFKIDDLKTVKNKYIKNANLDLKEMELKNSASAISKLSYQNYIAQLIEEYQSEKEENKNKIANLKKSKTDIQVVLNNNTADSIYEEEIKALKSKNIVISNKLNSLNMARKEFGSFKFESNKTDLIDFYDELISKNDRGSYFYLWEKYMEKELNDDMYLLLIQECKDIFQKSDKIDILNAKKGDLNFLNESKLIHHTAEMAEEYFKLPKYLESNNHLQFVKKLLKHMTQNVICYGFEIAIKKAIFQYLFSRMEGKASNTIRIVDNMFVSITNLTKDSVTMENLLYDTVAEQLVINSSPIFKNRAEELNFRSESISEIFSNYISLLEFSSTQFSESSELMKNLKYIIDYFSDISSIIIYNWHVTIENYFRFTINQSRVMKTFNGLSN